MSSAHTHSIALTGIEGHLVQVEADVTKGPPGLVLIGLPEATLRETTDRVRAAVINSGHTWPHRQITVTLTPVSLPKRASCFDAAIAIAVLAADGAVAAEALGGLILLGELGLDGRLRPISGVLAAVAAAAAHGFTAVAVPQANAAEAALVPGMRVLPAPGLAGLVAHLRGGGGGRAGVAPSAGPTPAGQTGPAAGNAASGSPVHGQAGLGDLPPSAASCRAAEICAAGGHHLAIVGPHDAGKTVLAEWLPALLPRLDDAAALEVTAVHSLAGSFSPDRPLITRPPMCAPPHHTATPAAILGGGRSTIRPGAVSLAHRGVLLLDDAPEFARQVLEALHQPLDSGEIVIARAGVIVRFPARFLLIAAASPCPCGQTGECACTALARRRYLGRFAGLWNWIDVRIHLQSPAVPGPVRSADEAGADAAGRVAAARQRAAARLAATPWRLNSEIPASELRRRFTPGTGALAVVERAVDLGQISPSALVRVLRVAWTLADLAGKPQPGAAETGEALGLWQGVTP